jgi:hypothetical protein
MIYSKLPIERAGISEWKKAILCGSKSIGEYMLYTLIQKFIVTAPNEIINDI